MRVLQGFFAIIQPMAFTIISDSIPPNQRAVATSMNNIVYLIGALIVTVSNAWILPAIPGAYPDNDDYRIFLTTLEVGIGCFVIAFILSLFIKESCPEVLLKREAKRHGAVYKTAKKDEISTGEAMKFVFGQGHMFCLFWAYVFGFGTSISN